MNKIIKNKNTFLIMLGIASIIYFSAISLTAADNENNLNNSPLFGYRTSHAIDSSDNIKIIRYGFNQEIIPAVSNSNFPLDDSLQVRGDTTYPAETCMESCVPYQCPTVDEFTCGGQFTCDGKTCENPTCIGGQQTCGIITCFYTCNDDTETCESTCWNTCSNTCWNTCTGKTCDDTCLIHSCGAYGPTQCGFGVTCKSDSCTPGGVTCFGFMGCTPAHQHDYPIRQLE